MHQDRGGFSLQTVWPLGTVGASGTSRDRSHADLHRPAWWIRGQTRGCRQRKSGSFLRGAPLGSVSKHREWGVASNDFSSAERLALGKESLRLGGRTGRDRSA